MAAIPFDQTPANTTRHLPAPVATHLLPEVGAPPWLQGPGGREARRGLSIGLLGLLALAVLCVGALAQGGPPAHLQFAPAPASQAGAGLALPATATPAATATRTATVAPTAPAAPPPATATRRPVPPPATAIPPRATVPPARPVPPTARPTLRPRPPVPTATPWPMPFDGPPTPVRGPITPTPGTGPAGNDWCQICFERSATIGAPTATTSKGATP